MTTSLQQEVSAIIASVNLVDVRLQAADVRTMIRDVAAVTNPRLAFNYLSKVAERIDSGFLVMARLSASVVGDGDELREPKADRPVSMQVTLALSYVLPDAGKYSDDALAEFAKVNAIFNAWPYWREFVQSTAARMQLPNLVLPSFRVMKPAGDTATETARPQIEAAQKGSETRGRRRLRKK